jgi:homopolymeric O-antigen transport system permease protein
MLAYARDVWTCRMFWLSLAWLDLRKRYRGSVLGFAWALVQPAVMALTFCLVFSGAFKVDFATHFLYVMVGLSFWNFFSGSIHQGCGSIFWSQTYILQHHAPMAIYPLRVVLANAYHFLLVISLVGTVVWTSGRIFHLPALLALVAGLLLLLVTSWSLAAMCGLLTPYFSDLGYLTDIALNILFYLTPIFYRPELLYERGLGFLVRWNPAAALVECVRRPLLEGEIPPASYFGLALAVALGSFSLAAWTMKKLERRVVFQI